MEHSRTRRAMALQRGVGGRGRAPISVCRSPAFRTCSRSPGRAARRCCATCRWQSSSTSEWITACIAICAGAVFARIEPEPEAVELAGSITSTRRELAATLLPQARHSWVSRRQRARQADAVFMPYAGGMARYRETCARSRPTGTRGFACSAPERLLRRGPCTIRRAAPSRGCGRRCGRHWPGSSVTG